MTSKAACYRERQRARGLRRVELWACDTASPEFQDRSRRSAELLRTRTSSAEEQEALAWCEAMAAEIDAAEQHALWKQE
jgi:hypothetical protein